MIEGQIQLLRDQLRHLIRLKTLMVSLYWLMYVLYPPIEFALYPPPIEFVFISVAWTAAS